jgi:hypothetical protein
MAVSKIESAGLDANTVAPFATSLSTVVGSAPSYACRAWVNFNGTGTVAIRASGNVSSITDNGTGIYTVNFTNAMSDTNYATTATCIDFSFGGVVCIQTNPANYTTSSVRILTFEKGANAYFDAAIVCVSIFR